MSPAMFVNVLALVHELSPLRAQEPLLVLFMAMACIRHQHLSVSTVTGNTDDFIFGRCPQGKCRRRGTRPPFDWAIPRPSCIPGAFSFILEVAERMDFPSFVIPARAKARRIPTRRWLPHPMGHRMAMRIIRQVFADAGMDKSHAEQMTFNTCRRFLPTLANVLQFSRHDCQAIGNWVEDQSAGASPATVLPMSVHYSDRKALASGVVKQRALAEFLSILREIPSVQPVIDGGSDRVSDADVSWDTIATIHQSRQTIVSSSPKDKKDKKSKKDKKHKHKRDDTGKCAKKANMEKRPVWDTTGLQR